VSGSVNLRSEDDRFGDSEPTGQPDLAGTHAAEDQPTRLREEAEQEASATRTRAVEQARADLAAARRVVDDAERSSALIRAEAARDAEARREEADQHAAQIVRDAERYAAALASTDEERVAAALADIAAYECRLRDHAEHLRAIATSLETASRDEAGSIPTDRAPVEQAPSPQPSGKSSREFEKPALG
jgi:hypothetical protein